LMGATLWHAGREYTPDEDGTITVPYSNKPSRQPIVLTHDGFSSLDHFNHQAENYKLSAGIYVDRESLLTRSKAQVLIRPSLMLNGTPVTLSVLEEVRLLITSKDRDGVVTTKEADDFKLFEDRETTYEFQVPRRLAAISFQLLGKVKNLSQNKKIDLATSNIFGLNEIARTDKIQDLHFSHIEGEYFVDLFGRSGEPLADRPVQFQIKHHDFKETVNVPLETNEQGRISLGKLAGTAWLKVTSPQGVSHTWSPLVDRHSYHRAVHGREGEPIEIPLMDAEDRPLDELISLLEVRGKVFVADRRSAAKVKNGMLTLTGLAPGDYELLLKPGGTQMQIRVTAGERRQRHLLGQRRHLEVRNLSPLQITGIETAKKDITIRLANSSKFARVHVFATRYQPAYSAYARLLIGDREASWSTLPTPESHYVEGRSIGDEYRYILERKYATKYPGNMLARPSLLLNPWPLRKTTAGHQPVSEGGEFESRSGGSGAVGGGRGARSGRAGGSNFTDLDFLGHGSAVLVNLAPNERGIVTIPREKLGGRQHLHVIAVDPNNTAYRTLALAETKRNFVDLRLVKGLDPEQHFTQQKRISVVKAKGRFELEDVTTSRFEAYDSLSGVYGLYATLNRDPKLVEFGFILNWHKMQDDEKRAKYTKYACHELNFFIYKKDPKFFDAVVKPFLGNKRDKTFMDDWLLGHDLSRYLEPWRHARLNIVEQTLLARRIEGERSATGRHVRELYDLLPPNIERFNQLFDTAVKGRALDPVTGGHLGAKYAAEKSKYLSAEMQKMNDKSALLEDDGEEPPGEKFAEKNSGGLGGDGQSDAEGRSDAEVGSVVVNSKAARSNQVELKKKPQALEQLQQAREEAKGRRDPRASAPKPQAKENGKDNLYRKADLAKRARARQLYTKLDKTQEWAENNYYRLPIEQQNAELVGVSAFWNDFAAHDPRQPFYSVHLADASRNFPEMMF
ncbi:MAG: hypothetical protein VB853_09980, partial [Pirellulales bacterium]